MAKIGTDPTSAFTDLRMAHAASYPSITGIMMSIRIASKLPAVTCAANGREAFDTFVDRPAGSFDAVLMDIMMPVTDGYEAACAIRRSVKADVGSVPIFAMTANAFAEDAQRAYDAGMNGHLTKPIDMEKVKQALVTARR